MFVRLQHLALVSLFAFAVACGGSDDDKDKDDDDDDDTGPGQLELIIAPGEVPLTLGGQASITVVANRPSALAAAPLALTVGGLPAGVTGEFDNATLQAGANATLTITASFEAVVGDPMITVTATPPGEGSLSAIANATLHIVSPAPISITGTVRNSLAFPAVGVIVHVLGRGASAVTDAVTTADGQFTVANITPPYDVNIVHTASGGSPTNNVFLDQVSATPTFGLPLVNQPTQASTMPFTLTVNGGTDGETVQYSLDCPTGADGSEGIIAAGVYTTNGLLPPPSTPTVNCVVRALTSDKVGDVATAFKKYGQQAVTLTAAGPNTIAVTVAGDVAERVITVQGATVDGEVINTVNATWLAGDHSGPVINKTVDPDGAMSILVPIDDRIPMALNLGKDSKFQVIKLVTPTMTAVDVLAASPATLTAPADASTNVNDSTVFQASVVPDATYAFQVAQGSTPLLHVMSATGSFTHGRLRALGAALPQNTTLGAVVAALRTTAADAPYSFRRTTARGVFEVDGSCIYISSAISFATGTVAP